MGDGSTPPTGNYSLEFKGYIPDTLGTDYIVIREKYVY